MWWRLKRSEYDRQKGEGNKQAFKSMVESGVKPGILAYVDEQPVAWCAVQPRETYPVLERSRNLQRVDNQPVWSIVCCFVHKSFRGQGLTVKLIRAAVDYAQAQGARIIEAYPIDPKTPDMPTVFAWTGFVSAYRQAGFEEVLRRSETRPIMRYSVPDGDRQRVRPTF
jgi:GNAT superfamily N-acetyltransferase